MKEFPTAAVISPSRIVTKNSVVRARTSATHTPPAQKSARTTHVHVTKGTKEMEKNAVLFATLTNARPVTPIHVEHFQSAPTNAPDTHAHVWTDTQWTMGRV